MAEWKKGCCHRLTQSLKISWSEAESYSDIKRLSLIVKGSRLARFLVSNGKVQDESEFLSLLHKNKGPMPLLIDSSVEKFGSVWAVYVCPEFRRQGIGRALMEHCVDHWKSLGCHAGFLLYASEEGKRVYSRY